MNRPDSVRGTPPGPLYCGHCGGDLQEEAYDGGSVPPSYAHQRCAHQLEMEPPRYCPHCSRRLKVQVSPLGWRAECSRHGLTLSQQAGAHAK